MKKDIHPQYYTEAKVTCSCGKSFSIGSTREKISVEICSNCHPYFTGNEKIVDTAGRVEKFRSRQEAGEKKKASTKKTKATKAEKKEPKSKVSDQSSKTEEEKEATSN